MVNKFSRRAWVGGCSYVTNVVCCPRSCVALLGPCRSRRDTVGAGTLTADEDAVDDLGAARRHLHALSCSTG